MTDTNNAAAPLDADLREPAIYVANLAAYNAGSLRGAWINPSSDEDELSEQIVAAIGGDADSEWAIHDYNDFPNLGENPSIKTVAQVAALFDKHGHDAVRAALDNVHNDVDRAESMLASGWREFPCLEDYAQELADDGVLDKEFLLRYVDWERVGRDLRHDLVVVEHDGKTFIFNE